MFNKPKHYCLGFEEEEALETVIVIEKGDAKEGYYRVSTDSRYVFEAICKTIGGQDKLLELRVSTIDSKPVEWFLKVPKQYAPSPARRPKKTGRVMSLENRAKSIERLKNFRAKKL